ncbi:MAG: oxidative damage protection protein [Candidatus Promineifilaceae bacterium]|nr:oxidative damage protection protein [Candidatus Promineifilaceae bacterium]
MARVEKIITVVDCAMLNEELPALPRPPFPGSLGERVYNEISRYAYRLWSERATLLINHYGLNMADPRAQEFLFQQMEEFLFKGGGSNPAAEGPPAKGAPRK